MSTINHFRLALLEQLRYHHQLEELISLKEEIEELRDKVALFQKKHRRCDRDITKHEQVTLPLILVPLLLTKIRL